MGTLLVKRILRSFALSLNKTGAVLLSFLAGITAIFLLVLDGD